MTSPLAYARQLLRILEHDRDAKLLRLDEYLAGNHDDPYMPDSADAEYKLLAQRAISNWMPLLVGTPAQALYVEGFRRGEQSGTVADQAPEWDHWQNSRLDDRQSAIYRGALGYGHSFTVTEKDRKGRVVTRGLSALRTAAVYDDPANDQEPVAALYVKRWNTGSGDTATVGKATLWTDKNVYDVTFKSPSDEKGVAVGNGRSHGLTECPVTRFAATIDLDGRTIGVIEPMIPLQNRINQTVFDLLVAQTYGSFKVRWATGMAPPLERDEEGEVVLDEHGQPKPLPINHNAKRMLFAEDHESRFGTLDETPLNGYIESIDMSIRHLSAISQTPPHHLLGQIANLSAEALLAAETALQRKIEEFRHGFGEAWERVFRLAAALNDDIAGSEDFHGEVLWRDMESKSLAQAADALGKLVEQLNIPKRGAWKRIPGVTQNELAEWEALADEEDSARMLAEGIYRATADPEEFDDDLDTSGSG